VQTYKFAQGWLQANPEEQKMIQECIDLCLLDKLKRLIHVIIRKDIGEKSLFELRQMASLFQIPHYGRYNKLKLYELIKEKLNEKSTVG